MTSTTLTATESGGELLLKQDRLGRVQIPKQKREAILAEYDRSGMSGQAFAKWAGITYSTFASWIQKRRGKEVIPKKKVASKWVEMVTSSLPADSGLVVELGNGVKVTISNESQAKLTGVLIRSLSC